MLFNSFAFAIFLPLVFALYWTFFNQKKVSVRNAFILAASYVFYGWWDWRFLILIALTSFCSWRSGILINNSSGSNSKISARFWLATNLVLNLGILAIFKYYNFFIETFVEAFSSVGVHLQPSTLQIVLPVGISFYTFQALSYSIDVYRKQIMPTRNWLQFFAFVSFFPQLVAGPIERAKNLLPQFELLKKPDYKVFRSAILLIAWGFFKKLMVADRLAVFIDSSFDNITTTAGLPMLLGIIFFAFQLYLDFSAYSDIAIGTAKLFGFDLMTNFRRPYLSTSFGNFWKRWHISLSSWFMDYVYIPLGGNRKGQYRTWLNVLIVFAVSGLWHGASWNFVIWGTLNAMFMILLDPVLNLIKSKNVIANCFKSLFIFACWTLSLVFFRAHGFQTALDCFANLGLSGAENIINFGLNSVELKLSLVLILIILLKEMVWEKSETSVPAVFYKMPLIFRWIFYIAFILSIVYFGQYGGENENAFIYFQF
ncbi:MAG: MBOAT family protein [Prevotellaceae bacterium]|jgi:D-alanyl-lipoteichoic acid acyltransferase DltB (MBOAT superfamily)|nr:MBOAT family protein [Prevotellaceae bacterium]